jgi:chaperonin GroEL
MPGQAIVFQPHTHDALHRGIRQIVGPVRATLGPLPRMVACTTQFAEPPEMLDKGSIIARRIVQLADRDADMGAMLVREMLWRVHTLAGDATATAAVLFEAVYSTGRQYLASGGNAMRLRDDLNEGARVIVDTLAEDVIRLHGAEALTRAAHTVSHDVALAAPLGQIFDMLDEAGQVDVRTSYTRDTYWEYIDGAYWPGGLLLPAELKDRRIELENPAVLLTDFTFAEPRAIAPAIECAVRAGLKTLVVLAENISEQTGAFLAANRTQAGFMVYAVKLPEQYRDRAGTLEDLRLLLGGRPFLKAAGDSLERMRPEHFGGARRVWADRDYFGLSGPKGDAAARADHIDRLRGQVSRADDLERRAMLRDRLGRLMGGSAVLWVGGLTTHDAKQRKQAAESAVETMRAIARGGVLPGGGIALRNCRAALETWACDCANTDRRAALRALLAGIDAPAHAILENAGHLPGGLLAHADACGPGFGIDVLTARPKHMAEAGIVDSADALMTAVKCAISAAATALTIDVLVHRPKPAMALEPGG